MSRRAQSRKRSGRQSPQFKKWNRSVKQARKKLSIKGFVAVNGKSAKGKALYKEAERLYNQ